MITRNSRVCIVTASRQNVFFTEILEAMGAMLREAGVTVEESVDCFAPLSDDLVYLYVPHEFHALVQALAHPTRAQLRQTVILSTEQPGSQWFELAAGLAAQAGAVVDINLLGVEHLRARGIAAEHLQLGYIPSWDHWNGDEESARDIDFSFLGGYTERRGQALANCLPNIQGRPAAIRLVEAARPHALGDRVFWSHDEKWNMMARTKVLLNVHRTALPYLEWHRFIGAQLNGCVVVSEHCVGIEPLVPGEHYVSAGYWQLPEVVGAVLEDPDRLRSVRRDAYEFLRHELPASLATERLLTAVERAGHRGPATAAAAQPEPMPMPAAPPVTKSAWETYTEHAGQDVAMRLGIKHLITRVQGLERHVATLLGAGGTAPATEVVHFGPEIARPEVSVALTVYNYADYVGDAIRSVALSQADGIELVAVDDCSSDASVEVVERAAELYPWLPITHVRLHHNVGLGAARNTAVEHARADLVFILDADNEVLPTGIDLLKGALEDNPEAGFAYGVIQTFDDNGSVDLMSWHPWEEAKFREGNYIDAMALVRRQALEEVGGYSSDPALYGWEDFAMWLELNERGNPGVQVPNFVARYRTSSHSMIAVASIDNTAAWATLLRRYPHLGGAAATGRAV